MTPHPVLSKVNYLCTCVAERFLQTLFTHKIFLNDMIANIRKYPLLSATSLPTFPFLFIHINEHGQGQQKSMKKTLATTVVLIKVRHESSERVINFNFGVVLMLTDTLIISVTQLPSTFLVTIKIESNLCYRFSAPPYNNLTPTDVKFYASVVA